MEKEGLIRSVEFFNQNNIKIKTLVTDRQTDSGKTVNSPSGGAGYKKDCFITV